MLKKDVGLKPYKKLQTAKLSIAQKEMRLERLKNLLDRYADHYLDLVIFSDEKLFSAEESFNSQNVRIYAACIEDIPEELRTVQLSSTRKK